MRLSKATLLTCTLAVAVTLPSDALAQVSTANKLNSNKPPRATQNQSGRDNLGAIPPNFNPPAGSTFGQRPAGRPTGERYWYTPDLIMLLKVRGDETDNMTSNVGGGTNGITRRELLPIFTWNLKTFPPSEEWPNYTRNALQNHDRRGTGLYGMKGKNMGNWDNARGQWTLVPEFEGWGVSVPHVGETANRMVTVLDNKNLYGTKVDVPFDAGLTRYELWVGKKASTTKDQQGQVGGWGQNAWFFDSYNVVNQNGKVLGSLKSTTSDSLLSSSRAVRNSPYILEATETPLVRRTFSQDATGGSAKLSEIPKMLVLTSPDGKGPLGADYYSWNRKGIGSANSGAGGRATIPHRLYEKDAGTGPQFAMNSDLGNTLAPNKNIEELAPDISKWWSKGATSWTFRRWQRAEDLLKSVHTAGGGKAFHRWILETKSDLLYAPNEAGNNNSVVISGQTAPDPETLRRLPEMVVGVTDVQGFDTGGFRVARGGTVLTGAGVWTDPDQITDNDGITVLPVGRFYPDSRIFVVVQYTLLDADGNPEIGGDWSKAKTARVFYWSSADPSQIDNGPGGPGGVWSSVSSSPDDSMKPRRIKFGGGSTFDPSVDSWTVSIRDLAHTSAQYRIRVFMALPFQALEPNGPIAPGGLASPGERPGANPVDGRMFDGEDMARVLAGNHFQPRWYEGSNAIAESLGHQPPAYYSMVESGVNMPAGGGKGWKFDAVSDNGQSVRYISNPQMISNIIRENRSEGNYPPSLEKDVQNADDLKNIFGTGKTAWFEYLADQMITWKIDAPQIEVGVDEEAAGTIITE